MLYSAVKLFKLKAAPRIKCIFYSNNSQEPIDDVRARLRLEDSFSAMTQTHKRTRLYFRTGDTVRNGAVKSGLRNS